MEARTRGSGPPAFCWTLSPVSSLSCCDNHNRIYKSIPTSMKALSRHAAGPHLVNARNWNTSRSPRRGAASSRRGSKVTGSVGSRTSAACPSPSRMSGKPAE
ncbi:hypothetical protein EYF80_037264 [Liparis tanakae]|uniref:Uncharacterized protein n=1 Tax=Liparis tanakae TaxID=230148 RepID=A0A4Z2GG34_9TELE|nr:hypothetical protein EYF80_037264 [Liparis tanakae]